MTSQNLPLARKNEKKDPSSGHLSWRDLPLGGVVPVAGNSCGYLTSRWAPGKIAWDSAVCIRCNKCYDVCPDSCVLKGADGKMCGIDEEHCKKCGLCVGVCPVKALKLEDA